MATPSDRWWNEPVLWIEAFAMLNVGFLAFDIFLAHSENQFSHRAEWIPFFFSLTAPLILLAGLTQRVKHRAIWKTFGYLIGWAAIMVGITGLILHLESHFFYDRTIRSLTYSAPFAAPLAYTGLGFLLVMNRMVDSKTVEWAQWVLLFTLGGFLGNFIFCLTDHAQNGFFFSVEWVPVAASAVAVGFLTAPLMLRVSRSFLDLCTAILVLEACVGLWGFVLHTTGNLRGPSIHAFDNFIYGAPSMAPLLFPNLMILGIIGLWQLRNNESYTTV